jgi:acyl-CoA reductase-like NAD-dependent aldehyde dehydrogenase/nicotinamidase-related amidase
MNSRAALILIDIQNDYLAAPGLQPAAGQIVDRAATLLTACRRLGIPVIHVQTTVRREMDNRMPHWRAAGKWQCEAGTPGHEPPPSLQAIEGEAIVHKQFFSGFGSAAGLDAKLRSLKSDTLILAGIHTHGCVRATALDAYERGYRTWIADDAIGSDDPLQAAITRRYLAARGSNFATSTRIISMLDPSTSDTSPRPVGAPHEEGSTTTARNAFKQWRDVKPPRRAQIVRTLADRLARQTDALAHLITQDIGKPITMSRGEVTRSAALLHAVADRAADPLQSASSPNASYRYQPLGVVAVVTPWNNPVAIPIGKVAPALLYGNTVVWKPAPPATAIAQRLMQLYRDAGWTIDGNDLVMLRTGDYAAACALANDPLIDAVTLSGSLQAGYSLQEICVRRHIPYQGELGGNNAAIVCEDADIKHAAEQIAAGAFGFAGQRCTANRRAIVLESVFDRFRKELEQTTAKLRWGDPFDPATIVGPLISIEKRDAVAALVNRATAAGMKALVPHARQPDYDDLLDSRGAYYPPTILIANDPSQETVQEETFGPVLVIQPAKTLDDALELLNGVKQGLIAAIFTSASVPQQQFLTEAQAGVLKINRGTADADAVSPLGGWKASGVGPAEHGPSDREFFCRVQTIYT